MRVFGCLLLLAASLAAGAAHSQTAASAADTAASDSTPNSTQNSTPAVEHLRITADGVMVAPPGWRTATRLEPRNVPDDSVPSWLDADHMNGIDTNTQSHVTLIGNAQVRRINGIAKGDRIDFDQNTNEVEITGSLRLFRDATLVTGPHGKLNIQTDQGEVDQPNFWLGANGGTARADHADILSKSKMRLTNVTYSGCSCEQPSWYIEATQLDIDYDANEGEATNAVLYFKNVPILASPWMTFPIKNERKSGLLLPTYGSSSRSGFDLTVPYYFNLAPNYDMTLAPRLLSKRGTMLEGQGRYLGESYRGTLDAAYLPDDNQLHRDRWSYDWKHLQKLGNGFYAYADMEDVSDSDYFRDMSKLGLNEATTTYLPKQATLGWSNTYWQASITSLKYTTLQDPYAPLLPPFDKLPEISLTGADYDWHGFDAVFTSSATRFSRPLFQGSNPAGDRYEAYPTLSYPIVRSSWYLTPKVGLHMTEYETNRFDSLLPGVGPNPGTGRDASRVLPIVSVDSGLTFDRQTTLFGRDATQTLEPRLYYLHVPYRNQSNLPVYDTTLGDFNFDQAFQENTYVGGWDRIANANQLTAGLTTRWIDNETGLERLSLSGAQRLYFEGQRVTLPGEIPRDNGRSDFLVDASAALTDTVSTEIGAQYNPYDSHLSQSYTTARWSPQRLTSVSLTYRYQRTPQYNVLYQPTAQNQLSLAFQWPFTKRWYGVGRIDYSLGSESANPGSSRVTQLIAGLEYKGDCCWAGRLFFQRYAVSASQENTAVFFQLELQGLGALGTDPMSMIRRNLPGYEPVTTPEPGASPYERYE